MAGEPGAVDLSPVVAGKLGEQVDALGDHVGGEPPLAVLAWAKLAPTCVPVAAPAAMVSVAGVTVKLLWTWGAAFQLASPAWLAAMVQVPAATRVTLLPETVQIAGVGELKLTGSPALEVATSATGEAESEVVGGAVKLIVWAPLAIVPETVVAVAVAGVAWLSVARIA